MQNLISFGGKLPKSSSHLLGVPKIPPSELGFVCKPEMPPHINILFRARPPMPFIPLSQRNITRRYTGIFEEGKNILDRFEKEPKPMEIEETKQMTKLKTLVEKLEKQKEINREKIKEWEPKLNPNATKDPYKTIFVYRLDPKLDEKKLQKEFEFYGEIRKVRIIRDLNGKSRGYGFIEFKHSSHFKYAEKQRKKKIKSRVIYIDYERGRTEKGWKPRRFGGGKGDNRKMPEWLGKQLEFVKKKYPELIKEKGEISDEQFLGRKKKRSHDKDILHHNYNGNSNHDDVEMNGNNNNEEDDEKTIKEENSSMNDKENKDVSPKKEYEVGEIV